jgi:hypothetical protein
VTKTTTHYKDIDWQDSHNRVFIKGVWVSYSDLDSFIEKLNTKDSNKDMRERCSEFKRLNNKCKGCEFYNRCDVSERIKGEEDNRQ